MVKGLPVVIMDSAIIKNRRREVAQEVERLQSRLAELNAELSELEIAERVIDRLSGGQRDSVSQGNEPQPQKPSRQNETSMTIRQMVMEALMDARQRGLRGLAPKDIREYISREFGKDIGQQVNTTASRMWRDIGEISKHEDGGLFYLPDRERDDRLI